MKRGTQPQTLGPGSLTGRASPSPSRLPTAADAPLRLPPPARAHHGLHIGPRRMRWVGHEEGADVAAAGDAQSDPRLHGALPRGRGQRRQRSRQAQHGGPRAAGPPPAERCYWRSRLSLIQPAVPVGQEAGSESRRTTTINRAGCARAHRGHARPATAPGRRLRTPGSRDGCGQSAANQLPIRTNQAGRPGLAPPPEAEGARQGALQRRAPPRRRRLAARGGAGRARKAARG